MNESVLYFLEHYKDSIQAKVQSFRTEDKTAIFWKGVYCLMTPATKAENANIKKELLQKNNFLFQASLEEIAFCLREKPYIRFHNQKAKRLDDWRKNGENYIDTLLTLEDEKEIRRYLVKNVNGMNFKEASHFLRNIGRGRSLAILDRHIIAFMKEIKILPVEADFNKAGPYYEKWETFFIDWAKSLALDVPTADYAVWAAGVKKHSPHLSYEYIIKELE